MGWSRPLFHDRIEAGEILGPRVRAKLHDGNVVVLALPGGGVAVGFAVSRLLYCDLDVFADRAELQRRVAGRTVVLVDEGLAAGEHMLAAIRAVRIWRPRGIVVAVPVAAAKACEAFAGQVDEILCGAVPEPFGSVGRWYEDFHPTSSDEVKELLARAGRERVV